MGAAMVDTRIYDVRSACDEKAVGTELQGAQPIIGWVNHKGMRLEWRLECQQIIAYDSLSSRKPNKPSHRHSFKLNSARQ